MSTKLTANAADFQRARTPAQKKERRSALLQAAIRVLERDGLALAGLNAIAREAGFSKANLYRYFDSREEIFLHILLEDQLLWTEGVAEKLNALDKTGKEKAVSRVLIGELMLFPRLITLAPALSSVLEHNVPTHVILKFKMDMQAAAEKINTGLKSALPGLSDNQARLFLGAFHHLVSGMAPAIDPPSAVQEAMESPVLVGTATDFEADLEEFLITFLKGLRT